MLDGSYTFFAFPPFLSHGKIRIKRLEFTCSYHLLSTNMDSELVQMSKKDLRIKIPLLGVT